MMPTATPAALTLVGTVQEFKAQPYVFIYSNPGANETFEIKFTIDTSMITAVGNKPAQFTIIPQATAAENPCTTKRPDTWTATFTILNADKYGQPTDQKAVDPKTGEVQEKTVAFQAVCEYQNNLRSIGTQIIMVPTAGGATPAPGAAAPAPEIPKIEVYAPAVLDADECPINYTSIGQFTDDGTIWGYDYLQVSPMNNAYLKLCVDNRLKDVIKLVQSESAESPCEAGWKHEGWIKNNLANWGMIGVYPIFKKDWMHLCVKEGYSEFAYFSVKSDLYYKDQILETKREQECYTKDYSFKGYFAFLQPRGVNSWKFAKAWSTADNGWKELSNDLPGIDEQYDWVGLCVKPVTIPAPAAK